MDTTTSTGIVSKGMSFEIVTVSWFFQSNLTSFKMLSIKFSADLLVLRSTSEQNEIAGTYAHLRGFFAN